MSSVGNGSSVVDCWIQTIYNVIRVYREKTQDFDLCACTSRKVIKHDFNEKQERILHFKGRLSDLELFWLIIDLKTSENAFFGKTPSVNGLNF